VRTLHESRGAGHVGSQERSDRTLSGISKTSGRESKATRAETEGQATLRFPRGKRPTALAGRLFFLHLAGEFFPGETLADNVPYKCVKPIRVIHAVAVVVAKSLFVNITEQVIRVYGNVGPV